MNQDLSALAYARALALFLVNALLLIAFGWLQIHGLPDFLRTQKALGNEVYLPVLLELYAHALILLFGFAAHICTGVACFYKPLIAGVLITLYAGLHALAYWLFFSL